MVDWNSPTALAAQAAAFLKLQHALAGVYFWEWATSLAFDWAYISGKKKFHWPMIFYFANRYCLFFAIIGILIGLDTTIPINCQALFTFIQLFGNGSTGLASINLALRTVVLWDHKLYIVIPIVLVILGHWSLILQGVLLTAEFFPGQGCNITKTNNTVLAATFIYSMCFDLLVMVLSAWKLVGRRKNSQLVGLLFKDGLVYFLVAFLSNVVATTFMLMKLNAVMTVMFNVPAVIASTVVACRSVRHLQNFATGVQVYSTGSRGAISQTRGAPANTAFAFTRSNNTPGHVHVQMETFKETDIDPSPISQKTHDYDIESAQSTLEYKPQAM
ncbi:hypothetical protein K474DRAFT_1711162 [Panus rudis PR-1116 ss-1]|nr:hypothetical protein K474DRAFT_1711162 [Panus rudis PR-1116 ss-1]